MSRGSRSKQSWPCELRKALLIMHSRGLWVAGSTCKKFEPNQSTNPVTSLKCSEIKALRIKLSNSYEPNNMAIDTILKANLTKKYSSQNRKTERGTTGKKSGSWIPVPHNMQQFGKRRNGWRAHNGNNTVSCRGDKNYSASLVENETGRGFRHGEWGDDALIKLQRRAWIKLLPARVRASTSPASTFNLGFFRDRPFPTTTLWTWWMRLLLQRTHRLRSAWSPAGWGSRSPQNATGKKKCRSLQLLAQPQSHSSHPCLSLDENQVQAVTWVENPTNLHVQLHKANYSRLRLLASQTALPGRLPNPSSTQKLRQQFFTNSNARRYWSQHFSWGTKLTPTTNLPSVSSLRAYEILVANSSRWQP